MRPHILSAGGLVVGNREVSLALVSALSIFTMRRHMLADIKRLVLWLSVVHEYKYKKI